MALRALKKRRPTKRFVDLDGSMARWAGDLQGRPGGGARQLQGCLDPEPRDLPGIPGYFS